MEGSKWKDQNGRIKREGSKGNRRFPLKADKGILIV
jgi:hypothetical protein